MQAENLHESIIPTDLQASWRGTALDGAELPVTCLLPAYSPPHCIILIVFLKLLYSYISFTLFYLFRSPHNLVSHDFCSHLPRQRVTALDCRLHYIYNNTCTDVIQCSNLLLFICIHV